jgi:membrane glycosyltransferase
MRRKRKKSYIDNDSPTIDIDNLVRDTTGKERFQLFEICNATRKYLVGLLMIVGAVAIFLSIQCFMGIQLFSSQSSFIVLIAMGFIGVANIICGLLLLAAE